MHVEIIFAYHQIKLPHCNIVKLINLVQLTIGDCYFFMLHEKIMIIY